MKCVFELYAEDGTNGHGWTEHDHTLRTQRFVSVNDVAAIASDLGCEFTVLYVQECISARPIFNIMGIPLVPGEMGKEWIAG